MGKIKKFFKFCLVTATLGASAVVLYQKVYLPFKDNSIIIDILETLTLPSNASVAFQDLSLPVEGVVRIHCNMLQACKFSLQFNTDSSAEDGSMVITSRGGLSSGAASATGDSGASSQPHHAVELEDIVLHEIVDPIFFEKVRHLQFTPAQVGSYLLMKYKTSPCEVFLASVNVTECYVRRVRDSNSYELTFDLSVYDSANHITATVCLPKRAQLLDVGVEGNDAVGAQSAKTAKWNESSPGEIALEVGHFSRRTLSRGAVAAAAGGKTTEGSAPRDRVPSGGDHKQQQDGETDANSSTAFQRTNSAFPAPMNSSIGSPNFALSDGAPIASLSFRMTFYVPEVQQPNSSDDRSGSGENLDVLVPGLSLSYVITTSCSGMTVNKLAVVGGTGRATYKQKGWDREPLRRTAMYRTQICQPIHVEPQF